MPERGSGYKTTPASSILCLSQIRMEANIAWRKAFLHASGLRCSMAFFWSFPSDRRFSPLPPAELSNVHPPGEALAMWSNKYHWFKRVTSREEHWLWILFVGQIALFFINSYFFLKMHESSNREITFPTKILLIFFIFIVSNLVFIYFRDNTYNFRLRHLVLDYITDNFKLDFN